VGDIERGRQALESIFSQARAAEEMHGYIGLPDGSGGHTVPVSHHPGFNFVRLVDGIEASIGEAINMGAMQDPALGVRIVRENGVLVVKSPSATDAVYIYGDNASGAANPPSIRLPQVGSDTLIGEMSLEGGRLTVFSAQLARLTGLQVRVTACHHRGGYWGGETLITLTPTATASQHSWALVGINTKTNAIAQALTANRSLAQGLLQADIASVIAANPDVDWRGAVDLANGDTTVNVLRIINLRNFGQSNQKTNFSATTAPTVADDSASGYGVGSVWIDTTNDKVYVCTDAAAGAALWKQTDGAGSVTSVGLTLPAEFSVTGSPVTGSGTLAGAWATQTTNKVFAAPNGSTGVPTFRALVAADIPTLDHGAKLSGLADDDHAQYALLAGRSSGQTVIGGTAITDILKLQGTAGNGTLTAAAIQALVGNNGATIATTILNNGNVGIGTIAPSARLEVAGSTDATQFIVRANATQSNSNPLIKLLSSGGTELLRLHSDNTNNLFLGKDAGRVNNVSGVGNEGLYNAFIGNGAGFSSTTGYNSTFIGVSAGYSNTTGYNNTFVGSFAGYNTTTGNNNTAQGSYALVSNTTGFNNVAQGNSVLTANTTGYENVAQGNYALVSNTTGYGNAAQGHSALNLLTTGINNTAQGFHAGSFIADGSTANATSNHSLYLGMYTKALANGDANEIVIGYNAIGVGTHSVVLGNDSITKTVLKGSVGLGTTTPAARLHVLNTTAGSLSSVVSSAIIGRNDTGTPLAGFGSGLALQLESSTTENTAVGSIDWLWNVATHASRAPDLVFNLIDSAATREIMRMRANGSAGAIGFFGATPVVRAAALTQTHSTADRTLSAYTADNESVAYTGIDNLQAGTIYGQVADVNALRVAYENLRVFAEDLAAFVNALVDDMQGYGLEQ